MLLLTVSKFREVVEGSSPVSSVMYGASVCKIYLLAVPVSPHLSYFSGRIYVLSKFLPDGDFIAQFLFRTSAFFAQEEV